jgi:polyisoprenoid-binding protein YceI
MARFDADSAECLVFTYKEGLLSAVAHDLKIRVTKFAIDVDEKARTVTAAFDARSLRVACAMRDGKEWRGELSAANKREIEGNIVRDVLKAEAHPEIRFASTRVREDADGFQVTGTLTLCGKKRTIAVPLRRVRDRWVAEATIHQPEFGIRPFAALLGALKVQADVTVRVSVPAPRR